MATRRSLARLDPSPACLTDVDPFLVPGGGRGSVWIAIPREINTSKVRLADPALRGPGSPSRTDYPPSSVGRVLPTWSVPHVANADGLGACVCAHCARWASYPALAGRNKRICNQSVSCARGVFCCLVGHAGGSSPRRLCAIASCCPRHGLRLGSGPVHFGAIPVALCLAR